jgi:hypothetical protein
MTRSRNLVLSLLATLSFVIVAASFPALGQQANAKQVPAGRTIVKFNAPGAGTSSGQGTQPFGIVADGTILGVYIDSSNVYHGFLRSPTAVITTIDDPDAGTASGQGTYPSGINSALTVVGVYWDSSGLLHGFMRTADGTYTTIDDPLAAKGSGASDINTKGEIAGQYTDSNGVTHGYLRSPTGAFSTIDDPDAGTASGQGTSPAGLSGLTDTGAVAGGYTDSSGGAHVFLRTPTGTFTTVDPVGSAYTQIAGLSANQTVAGLWVDTIGIHGFTSLNGVTTSFDAPNSTATVANNINSQGTIAGDYYDTNGASHGYLRSPGGTFSEFSIPGAGTSSGQGTVAGESNAKGQITGYYIDSSGVNHGFVIE